MKRIFSLFIFSVFSMILWSQSGNEEIAAGIEKETFIFARKDTATLKLDRYRLENHSEVQPCVIFVFGGGFFTGTRDAPGYNNYFNFLCKEGYTVISIDYRLGLKGETKSLGITNYKPLQKSIAWAVDDLYDATNYVLQHAKEWNIDTTKIILSGSSAGAITVLQGEYENRNKYEPSDKLPPYFHYAGVISFAGAIFSTKGGLNWKENKPCPMLLFHGDKDKTVPYKQIRFFKLGFFGSSQIVNYLKKEPNSYWFISFEGAAHEIAIEPTKERQPEIKQFLDEFIFQRKPSQVETSVNEMWKIKNKNAPSYKDLY